MPKIKSRSGMKKRFKVTGSGKIIHKRAGKGHFNRRKSASRLRRLKIETTLKGSIEKRVRKLINA